MNYFILQDRNIVSVTMMQWASWMETASNRKIQLTRVGPYTVSTVFLGLDHNFGRKGPPVLFETMAWTDMPDEIPALKSYNLPARIMDRTFEDLQRRCCTYDEALLQHQAVIDELREPGDKVEDLEHEIKRAVRNSRAERVRRDK